MSDVGVNPISDEKMTEVIVFEDSFEWEQSKATSNKNKHGISFEVASQIFLRECLYFLDDRSDPSEERWIAIGLVAEAAVVVVYTDRGERLRLISARRATKQEREMLFRELGTKV